MLFSIILPTYNRATLLPATIDSILAQRFPDFELIIVDDGSTDGTETMISSKYGTSAQLRYIKRSNTERGAARNYGTSIANGEYVIFFDSDDIMYPNQLEEAKKFIDHNKEAGAFHLNYEIKDSQGNFQRTGPFRNSSVSKELIAGNFLSCDGVVLKKELAKQ